MQKGKNYHFETLQIHVGQEEGDRATGARAVPIYATTSFVFDNCQDAADRFNLTKEGNIYTRIGNPTTAIFEERLAALEGGVGALALASGQAATTLALQNLAQSGDHIVSSRTIYGGTYNLLARTLTQQGITTTLVDVDDYEAMEEAIQPNTKALFIESIGNPNGNIADIERIAAICQRNKIPLVVDNTFASPYLLRPIEWGANIVIHSATKFIGGHGTVIGGAIVDGGNFDWRESGKFPSLVEEDPSYHGISYVEAAGKGAFIMRARVVLLRDYGATMSPFNAFLLLQGVETLSLRVERHVANALEVVKFLAKHDLVERVNHPSLSTNPTHPLYQKYFPLGGVSIFTFVVKGGEERAKKFIDNLELFSLLANVADAKSLVIHPASTTHNQLTGEQLKEGGIEEGTVRLSIGLEHIDDLLGDLSQALEGAR